MASDAFQRVWLTQERDLYNLHYEVIPLMEIHGPTPMPTTGDQAFSDLRTLGIEWVMVTEADRLLNEPNYLSHVITTHGKIEFSERGWDLYRLVTQPPRPAPLSACDAVSSEVPACWGTARTNNLTVSVTRSISVCPGQTLAVDVTEAAGGSPSSVLIQFAGVDPINSVQSGAAVAGTEQTIYASVPSGATSASVVINPSAGTRITSARIGRLGQTCPISLFTAAHRPPTDWQSNR